MSVMGTRSLQCDSNPRRKRSFTALPRLRKAEEQQSAEETARIRKAAAWQWYTRGVGEAVVPTKRPIPGLAGGAAAVGGGETSSSGKKFVPPAADPRTRRAASRFKAEASADRGRPGGATATPIPAGPSPLYDEFELSSLKAQMADFVQRLQKKQSQQRAAKPLHSDHAPAAPAADHTSACTQPLQPASGEDSGILRFNSGSVEGSGFRRSIVALQRLFRRVMPKNNPAANIHEEPEVTPDEPKPEPEPDDVQYHYHHYIHHHHHHYHYGGPSPEEAELIRRRRHSESSGIRPRIPSLIWEGNEASLNEEDEQSPLSAFIARRRRHSDGGLNAEHINAKKNTDCDIGVEWPDKEGAVKLAELQFPRRYNSERFTSRNIVPNLGKGAELGDGRRQGEDIKSRRRHSSTESFRDGEAANVRWINMGAEAKAREGSEDGGGVYKLGGGGVYECKPVVRRRHSESVDVTWKRGVIMADQEFTYKREGLSGWPRAPASGGPPLASCLRNLPQQLPACIDINDGWVK